MKTLAKIFSRPGATAGTTGALVALQLLLWRAVASATDASVTLAGRELNWACSFKQQFGVPCPNCGMTRSVLLSLQGDFWQAIALNPAGPVLVLGVVLFSAAMFLLMHRQQTRGAAAAERLLRRIRLGAFAYGALTLAVWLGHWVSEIS